MTATTDRGETTRTARAVNRPAFWYRDLISCLQATFGTVLHQRGLDPLTVLGAGWEFLYLPGDVRGEEFYYPCRPPGDIGRALAPHHPVSATWHTAPDDDPLRVLAELVAAGELPIAAVDNYHLPFRPAFHDVHAAHLVVVYGVDRFRGLVHVSDAMPPAFTGPVRAEDFLNAWGSANPADEQDAFFSDARIGRRYLTVDVGPDVPTLDREWLSDVLRANVAGFAQERAGWSGLTRYLRWLSAAAAAGDADPLREAYVFGWGMQALSSLHGELLRRQGARWSDAALSEAGRRVESAAHSWTGLRVTAAHGWPDPRAAAADIDRHGQRLRERYEIALAALDRVAALP